MRGIAAARRRARSRDAATAFVNRSISFGEAPRRLSRSMRGSSATQSAAMPSRSSASRWSMEDVGGIDRRESVGILSAKLTDRSGRGCVRKRARYDGCLTCRRSIFMHRIAFLVFLVALVVGIAEAKTLRWAGRGDMQTTDPHSQNENLTNNINLLIYEFLLYRDK